MFSKLLKHEWRANRGLMGLLSLAALGIGIMAAIVLRVLVNYGGEMLSSDDIALELSAMGMYAMLFFSAVALCVYAVAVQFVLLYRFYKNKFTDEGYLTFTLPVKTWQIYWSSLLNMLLWMAISLAVIAVVVSLVVLIGTAKDGFINTDIFAALDELRYYLGQMDMDEVLQWEPLDSYMAAGVLQLIQMLIAPFYGLIVPMACITMGAVLAKKHKILASFGIYYAVNFVVGIVSSVATMVPSVLFLGTADMGPYMVTTAAIELIITLGLSLGGYFTTLALMKHKLNLP
ncbi:MAG: hypothetical protein IJ448_00680 [Oscillospiraceae bacterium]|nr:hypothetical protein [Oscillospiraceae bacterium]